MYGLFYMSYMVFGGITALLGGVRVIDAFRKREELHQAHVRDATATGYWTGYGEAWTIAHRQGEESALQICQMLAMESAEMVGLEQQQYNDFGQLVSSWPEYVITPMTLPTSTSGMFLE